MMRFHFEILGYLGNWEENIDKIRKILEQEQSEGLTRFVLQKIGPTALLMIWPEARKKFPHLFINFGGSR